ncbi:hypothetical protein PHIGD17-1_39 [Mycobacterium phage phiGD17-1]|nr:hypothetical protein PHIGD17-1_39 [Mycobacterium phage phiGD17-1]
MDGNSHDVMAVRHCVRLSLTVQKSEYPLVYPYFWIVLDCC